MIKKAKDAITLFVKSFRFFLRIDKSVDYYTHNIYREEKDSAKMVATSLLDIIKFGKEMENGLIFINGKKAEYFKTASVIDLEGEFYYVILYK